MGVTSYTHCKGGRTGPAGLALAGPLLGQSAKFF